MQTSIRRTHRDRVVRRGAAIMAESDFYRTEAGIRQFSNEVRSVQQCVQLTCNYDVMYAYLTNSGYARDYEIRKQIMNTRNVMTYLRRQIATYGVLCKGGENGLDIALETARRVMAQYNVSPDMVIMDPATQLYLRMIPQENKQHHLSGDTAVQQYNAFNGGRGIAEYRGLQVYTQTHFDVGEHTQNVNMLERNTQVGEYYVMKPPDYLGADRLPPTYMNLLIFDEDQDRNVMITFEDAVLHACPWQLKLDSSTTDPFAIRGMNKSRYQTLIEKSIELIGNDAKTSVKAALESSKTYATTAQVATDVVEFFDNFNYENKNEWEKVIKLVDAGVWVPINLVIARPFIEHRMLSMIVTVAGSDTGMTVYGQSDFQIASNVNVKMIEGHFTFHSKAVITNPKNIMVLEDVQCNGYVGGCNTKWFGDMGDGGNTDFKKKIKGDAESTAVAIKMIKDNIHHRIDVDNETDTVHMASLMAFAAPFDQTSTYFQHQMFAMGNGPLPWDQNGMAGRNFPGGKNFLNAYTTLFDLSYLSTGIDLGSTMSSAYLRQGTCTNTVCVLGPSRHYNPFNKSGQYDLMPGQGHFGPDAVAGDARWRRGETINAKQAREEHIDPATIVFHK